MAITVADAATLVSEQLNIQPSASTPPDSTMLADYIRRGARRLFSEQRPIFLASAITLSTGLTGTLQNKARIVHIEVNNHALLDTEWRETPTGFHITGYEWLREKTTSSHTALVWYVKSAAIAKDATTIDLDCIHGADWGYEYLVTYAEMLAELRLSSADVPTAMLHLQRYRTLEAMLTDQAARLQAARADDLAALVQRQTGRLQYGDLPFRQNALAGFRHEGETANRTTGEV